MSDPGQMTSRSVTASAAVVVAALVARVHNLTAFPALHDFDGPGHALNVFALYRGELPDPRSWSGGHPPLYHALGALLWRLLPEAIPVHVALRAISFVATVLVLALTWRTLRRVFDPADAAVASTSIFCVPGVVAATGMVGNDALCALFATLVLSRLVDLRLGAAPTLRHAALTGLCAGLAALTKATGALAVGVAGIAYAWRLRRAPRRALAVLASLGIVVAVVTAPHYGRLFARVSGSSLDVVTIGGSVEKEVVMADQEPSVRHAWHYATLPRSTFTRPDRHDPALEISVPGLLHAALWAEGFGNFVPLRPNTLNPKRAFALLGLLPTAVLLLGALRLLRRRDLLRPVAFPLLYGLLLFVAFLQITWSFPASSSVKPSYMTSALLPAAALVAAGLGAWRGIARRVVRGALLAIAVLGVGFTWYGWWGVRVVTPAEPIRSADYDGVVERYFRDLRSDPVRTLELLTPRFHERHHLRVRPDVPTVGDPATVREVEQLRAQLGWLWALTMDGYPAAASTLGGSVVRHRRTPSGASVVVRVEPPVGDAFEQSFELLRDEGDRWRIDRITQRGLTPETREAGFVAAPTLEARPAARRSRPGPGAGAAPGA